MNEQMEFPETWEEYEQEYGFNDSDEVYTNNSRLIQSFRVKQWLDHLEQEPKTGHWITVTNGRGGHECSLCHEYAPSYQNGDEWLTKYCPNCGARMVEQETKINEDISKGFEEFTRMMFKQGQAESEE